MTMIVGSRFDVVYRGYGCRASVTDRWRETFDGSVESQVAIESLQADRDFLVFPVARENLMGCPNGGAGEDRFVGEFPLDDPDDDEDEVVDPPAFEGERDLRHPAGKVECWKCGGKIRGEYLQEEDGSKRHVNACPPISRHTSVSRFIAECDAEDRAAKVGENRPNVCEFCDAPKDIDKPCAYCRENRPNGETDAR